MLLAFALLYCKCRELHRGKHITRCIGLNFPLFYSILLHSDWLLGNDREISKYTAAVIESWLCKQPRLETGTQ
jgi:hypothetical protein